MKKSLQQARLKKTEKSATEVEVETDITAQASTTLRAITAMAETETDTMETRDRAITERRLKSARGGNEMSGDATTSTMIEYDENTRTDEVDLPLARTRTA